MTVSAFHKVSALLLAGLLGSQAQAQVPDIPAGVSGTYTLTYAFAGSGSPFTNGTVKTFVLNGSTDTMCVDGVSLGTGYYRAGVGSEMLWNGGNGTYYALSLRTGGAFNEINVYSPSDAGSNWKGQFPGPGTFSSSTTCGASAPPAFTAEQLSLIGVAGELYPDLFLVSGDVKSAQGYTYTTFTSGVSVGFKDGSLYLAGGPFGAAIQNMGTVAQVQAKLQTLKASVTTSPTTDMTSLLSLAAKAYPALFSGTGSEFRTTADGYLYRYYANTGVYAAFKNGNVYVKGGSFGNAFTSVGALNSLLSALDVKVNGSTPVIPSGNYNLTVSGTVTISGPIAISQPFSYTINGIPAPSVADEAAIKKAFSDSLSGQSANGITITNFSYTTISNTANLVEFDVSVSATINTSGFSTGYTYALKYKYTK